MSLIDDFKAKFPDFDTTGIDAAWTSLEAAWPCYYAFTYGSSDCADEATLNLIAHLFVVSSTAGNAAFNSVSSQSVGSVSQSFHTPGTVTDRAIFFNSTKYGQAFLILTKPRQGAYFV